MGTFLPSCMTHVTTIKEILNREVINGRVEYVYRYFFQLDSDEDGYLSLSESTIPPPPPPARFKPVLSEDSGNINNKIIRKDAIKKQEDIQYLDIDAGNCGAGQTMASTPNLKHFERLLIVTPVYIIGLDPVIFEEWVELLGLARDRAATNHIKALYKLYRNGRYTNMTAKPRET